MTRIGVMGSYRSITPASSKDTNSASTSEQDECNDCWDVDLHYIFAILFCVVALLPFCPVQLDFIVRKKPQTLCCRPSQTKLSRVVMDVGC
jgi:hypothetical protein